MRNSGSCPGSYQTAVHHINVLDVDCRGRANTINSEPFVTRLLITRSLSAREKIDEDAEHYCAIHSPPRRKKMLQDKVKTGIDKINSLKQIEQNKDLTAKYVKETKLKQQVRLQRSASERIPNRNASSLLMKKDSSPQQRISHGGNQSLIRKVTFNSEEQMKFPKDSPTKAISEIRNTPARRSVTPT